MFPCYTLLNMKATWDYYFLLVNPGKFMIGYLYFSNFKDIKDHIEAYLISCKIFYQ